MNDKMKLAAQYRAGATRHELKIITNETPAKNGFRQHWCADRVNVGVFRGKKSTTVFVNPPRRQSGERVWIGIVTGYGINKHQGEFLVFETSEAACDSGALIVAQLGSSIAIHAYKNRGPVSYYRLTEEGLVSITDEVSADKQEPL